MKKYSVCIYFGMTLLLMFLVDILLKEEASYSLYILSLTTGVFSFLIGQMYSLKDHRLGFGKTRRQLEKEFIVHLGMVILFSIVSIALNYLFIFCIYRVFAPQIRMIIFTYLLALYLGMLGLLVQNVNIKYGIFIFIGGVMILVGTFFIPNRVICDVILAFFIVLFYILNKILFRKIQLRG